MPWEYKLPGTQNLVCSQAMLKWACQRSEARHVSKAARQRRRRRARRVTSAQRAGVSGASKRGWPGSWASRHLREGVRVVGVVLAEPRTRPSALVLEVVVGDRDARAPPPRRVRVHDDLGQLAQEAPRAPRRDGAVEQLPDALGGDGRRVEGEEENADGPRHEALVDTLLSAEAAEQRDVEQAATRLRGEQVGAARRSQRVLELLLELGHLVERAVEHGRAEMKDLLGAAHELALVLRELGRRHDRDERLAGRAVDRLVDRVGEGLRGGRGVEGAWIEGAWIE
eukprot:7391477-Prymnesium_polylepis.1